MNTKVKSLVFLLIAVCVSNVKASEVAQNIVGCWQGSIKEVICYQADGVMYINIGTFTVFGDWHAKNNSLYITLNKKETQMDVVSITTETLSFKEPNSSKVEINSKTPHQPPNTKPVKKSSASNNAQSAAQDIADMVTNTSHNKFSMVGDDLLLKSPHCRNTPEFHSIVSDKLSSLEIENSDSLVNSFFSLICQAQQTSALSKVLTKEPFLQSNAFYSGMKKLGDWPCELGETESNDLVFQGIFLGRNQVTRWQNTNKNEVNIWLASFYSSPSDAMRFTMQYKDKAWHFNSLCYSIRI